MKLFITIQGEQLYVQSRTPVDDSDGIAEIFKEVASDENVLGISYNELMELGEGEHDVSGEGEVPPPKNKRLLSSPIYKSLILKDAEERQAKLDDTVAQLIADNIDPNDEDAEEKARTLSEMIVAMQPDQE
jgi:hypothetical protein